MPPVRDGQSAHDLPKRIRARMESRLGSEPVSPSRLQALFQEILDSEGILLSKAEKQRLFEQVVAQLPPEPWENLLADDTLQEIVIIGPKDVFVRHMDSDQLERMPGIQFDNEDHLVRVINRLIGMANQRLDHGTPVAQVKMPDGSCVRALLDTFGTGRSVLIIHKALQSH